MRAHDDHEEHDGDLQDHDGGVEAGAFLNALHQNDGDEHGDDDRGQIEPGAGERQLPAVRDRNRKARW